MGRVGRVMVNYCGRCRYTMASSHKLLSRYYSSIHARSVRHQLRHNNFTEHVWVMPLTYKAENIAEITCLLTYAIRRRVENSRGHSMQPASRLDAVSPAETDQTVSGSTNTAPTIPSHVAINPLKPLYRLTDHSEQRDH